MKIKKITWQLRRDFTAIFECEHCGFEEKRDGYDDAFFHQNVIPSMKCDKCGKTAGDDYRPLAPKYGDWLCDKCKATVIAVQEDKAKAKENKTKPEINWLKLWTWVAVSLACIGFWAGVVHFAWGYYVS